MVERNVDQRLQAFVVQTLQRRAKHQQLLFVALCNLRSRHALVGARKHQKQVSVERAVDALTHILDVEQQTLKVRVNLPQRTNALAVAVNLRMTTGQSVYLTAFHQRWSLSGRLRQVVKDLTLPTLLVLQLLHVAQRRHAWAVAVDVLTRHRPARSNDRELAEARLSEHVLNI